MYLTYIILFNNLLCDFANLFINDIKQFLSNNSGKIIGYLKNILDIFSGIFDVFVSIVVSVYILLQRTSIVGALRRFARAVLNKNTYEAFNRYFTKANQVFFTYITSQLLDAFIVGALTTVAMLLLKVQYAPLIGFMIGLFNLIPYVGAIVGVVIGGIVKRLRHPASRAQEQLGDMVSVLDESLSGIKIIKTYTATEYIRIKFHQINAELSRLMLWMARRQQLASPMSEFLGITAVAVVLVFGGALVTKGSMSAAGFIAFIAAFSQITRPVRAFIDQFANINQGVAAGERIFEVIDAQSEITDSAEATEFEGLKDKIEFRNICFSYDGNREILHNINFTINKGETVALVGASGGGKSTLSELMPRFYDPSVGEILVDGKPLKSFTQESLRRSLVSQDTVLFNDTIRENIALGKQGATDSEIVEAAKIANAHDFIIAATDGYNTNIGDRGAKLSGGQRQRLSIARAVLKNPEFLILDEATSALDTESEKLVQQALTRMLKGRTSVVIAHRLSTIQHADKIIVVDEGRIAEQGTHEQLIARGGIYAKLIEMQSLK